jgi:hypothetical protein
MKVTVVPAQVTTVEDRIAGSLSFSQLVLFALPVFSGSLLYAALPPSMGASLYKIVIIVVIAVVCMVFAIRIKGKIILLWLIVLLRYNLRPKLYLFNKNILIYRENYPEHPTSSDHTEARAESQQRRMLPTKLSLAETARAYATLDDPVRKLRFETTKKGGLNVRLTEIEE